MSLKSCNSNRLRPKSSLSLLRHLKKEIESSRSSDCDKSGSKYKGKKTKSKNTDDNNKFDNNHKLPNRLHIHPAPPSTTPNTINTNTDTTINIKCADMYLDNEIGGNDQTGFTSMETGDVEEIAAAQMNPTPDPLSCTMSTTPRQQSQGTQRHESNAELISSKKKVKSSKIDDKTRKRTGSAAAYDIDLVNVMNKMTLLVCITVFGSILSVVGNIFIEIHELETIKQHTADVESMWAFCLPVIDMVITSFALYLQFNFTDSTYSKCCTSLDILFLKLCLKMNTYRLRKAGLHNETGDISEDTDNVEMSPNTVSTPNAEGDVVVVELDDNGPNSAIASAPNSELKLKNEMSLSLVDASNHSNPMRNGTWTCSVNE